MTINQYNNIIRWTLAQSDKKEDSLTVGKKIFKNLGMPFPNGDYKEILRTLMSGNYMGWKACTLEQAGKCAEQGIPAVGINAERVIVIAPSEAEEVVINEAEDILATKTNEAIALSVDEIDVEERMDMQFFAYATIEEALGTNAVAVQMAGGTGGIRYSYPRYTTTSVVVRTEPGNNAAKVVTILSNTVVIIVNGIPQSKDGYNWIKVKCFVVGQKICNEYTGWIAVEFTAGLSQAIPQKNSVCSALNTSYKDNQRAMLINARYIHNFLSNLSSSYKWKDDAIFAMLGNMVEESSINPNQWQNNKTNNMNYGYGLTQWTPATKYINWVDAKGGVREDIDWQLERILYEVKNNEQWGSERYPAHISFYVFTKIGDSIENLAEYFLKYYENCADAAAQVTYRQNLAKMCKAWIEAF